LYFSKRLNSSLKSGLVSMSVPDRQIVGYHVQGRLKDGGITLGLPERYIEPVIGVADSSVGVLNLFHVFPYKQAGRHVGRICGSVEEQRAKKPQAHQSDNGFSVALQGGLRFRRQLGNNAAADKDKQRKKSQDDESEEYVEDDFHGQRISNNSEKIKRNEWLGRLAQIEIGIGIEIGVGVEHGHGHE
ncbi:MAG: hypothetical protein SWC96_04785, partial [Thermodesulfobacteriota bacterium]|nr:hypothetical protein [Thermodesulfobacteriota bacterium]